MKSARPGAHPSLRQLEQFAAALEGNLTTFELQVANEQYLAEVGGLPGQAQEMTPPMRPKRIPRTPQQAAQQAFGKAVRELRACRILSQEELGFRCRLHRNYIGAIERGEINPTLRTLLALASGLQVELSALIRLYEEREQPLPPLRPRPAHADHSSQQLVRAKPGPV